MIDRLLRQTLLATGLAFAVGVAHAQDGDSPAASPRFVNGNAAAGAAALAALRGDASANGADAATPDNQPRTTRQAHFEIDTATRTLIVTTDPATNNQIRDIVKALDQPVPQALIKVLFLEVTHNNDTDMGVDFSKLELRPNGDRTVVSTVLGNTAASQGGIVQILNADLDVTLHALAEVGTLNVLSRPSILTRNNTEATITIGQEVPFITNSRITTDGQTLNTVEYEDIGIILTVTPHIGKNGLIELDVAPEISTLTKDTVQISDNVNASVIAKRSAETHVVVPSGKTVVIGGLMQDQETTTDTKVPVLGDIPWVGSLFKRKQTTKSKTELLIFLTPTIVRNGDELVELSTQEHAQTRLISSENDPAVLKKYLDTPATTEPTDVVVDTPASAAPKK